MTTSKIETLTDEERELLSSLEKGWTANKALRIIDAHAAERAALTEQVAQLTRERDEARALHEQALNERDEAHKALELDCWNRSHDAEYEVARLTEQVAQLTAALENIALGTVHPAEREVARLTEQVAQLTRERDQIKVRLAVSRGCRKVAKAEVARLTEALAAAEKKQSDTERWRGWERDRAEAAEPRMRELEAQLLTARHRHEETRQQLATCTSELAALRERVADARRKLTCPHRSDTIRVKDALEALRGI